MSRRTRARKSGDAGLNRAGQWWLAAGALVVGLVLGVVLTGLLSEGSPLPGEAAAESSADATTASTAAATTGSSGATAEIVVNEACLRAINAARDTYRSLDDIGEAASNLDAAQLDDIIRRLQPLRSALTVSFDACRIATQQEDGGTVTSEVPLTTGSQEGDATSTTTATVVAPSSETSAGG